LVWHVAFPLRLQFTSGSVYVRSAIPLAAEVEGCPPPPPGGILRVTCLE
jgi:hypothetical protein